MLVPPMAATGPLSGCVGRSESGQAVTAEPPLNRPTVQPARGGPEGRAGDLNLLNQPEGFEGRERDADASLGEVHPVVSHERVAIDHEGPPKPARRGRERPRKVPV
ncbi:hypothetical protein QA634_34790 [Methylobacterium sp. CB376]|uniref:hypothetical protein n=1 Tax=unclassified Methylobacterium TaxID=2615210 RepID=UPI00143C8099|nr:MULTISPECIES: hypothetical protein [Methylobacterium]WFT80276.1 hypothetical protein QA634_34790 [Methylobacterium nodulans]